MTEGPSEFDPLEAGALVDRLAGIYAEPPWAEEIERARAEYDRVRGRIFDDDELYSQHMASFLEWYVLERCLPDGRTPAVEALTGGLLSGAAERALAGAMAKSHRSLFEVLRLRADALLLADLILGGRWRVDWRPAAGVARGDVFEARLVPWCGRVCFGPVLMFHPRVARQQIHSLLQTWAARGLLGAGAVAALAEMRLRFSRFRNIAVEHVYRDGSQRVAGDCQAAGARGG